MRTVVNAQIVLVTAEDLPKPEGESVEIVAALGRVGVTAEIAAWSRPRDWAAAPLVVIRSPWDYVQRLDAFLAWAREVGRATRLLNPPAVVEWNARKDYLFELHRREVSVVPSRIVRAGTGVDAEDLRAMGEGELVVKPTVGIGGHDARRGRAGDEALLRHLRHLLGRGDVLVQPFVPAVATEGETSLVYFGGVFSHAVRKRPGAGEFRVQDHHGGVVLDHEPTAAEREVAEAAIGAAPDEVAYARVDLVSWRGRPAVMELELIEPELFLRRAPGAADRVAAVLRSELERGR